MNVTRIAGPFGPRLIRNILSKRISEMPQQSALRNGTIDVRELAEYIYHNWALKASSEKVLKTHLAPGGYGIRPLIDMLEPDRLSMPLTFIYGGESDWMDY